jgi:hypothetical protein
MAVDQAQETKTPQSLDAPAQVGQSDKIAELPHSGKIEKQHKRQPTRPQSRSNQPGLPRIALPRDDQKHRETNQINPEQDHGHLHR